MTLIEIKACQLPLAGFLSAGLQGLSTRQPGAQAPRMHDYLLGVSPPALSWVQVSVNVTVPSVIYSFFRQVVGHVDVGVGDVYTGVVSSVPYVSSASSYTQP